VAREHDRHRVAVHDSADRAGGAGPAGPGGERAVGRHFAVRDTGELVEDGTAELARGAEVDRQVELAPLPGEVLVELASCLVGRAGRAQHARSEGASEPLRLHIRVGVEMDLADAVIGDCDEQPPDRGVVQLVGDVEQPLGSGGVAEATVELCGNVHDSSFRRKRRTPDDAAWRAASGDEPSALPMSS